MTAPLPTSVLFVCTHNSIRSAMAEWMLKHLHGSRIYVDSVGLHPSEPDPFAVVVMDEIGIDLRRHRWKVFDQLRDTSYDLVVTMSLEAHHNVLEMTRTMSGEIEYWKVMDPSGMEGNREARLQAYRDVRDTILKKINDRFPAA